MEKHFVCFYSPGSFTSEVSQKPIDKWDVNLAKEIARTIKERHGATPYGFKFITRSRSNDDLDSKVSETSPMYYLGGKIGTLEEIKLKNDPRDNILIDNMERNNYKRVVTNKNSYCFTTYLNDTDIVLQWD